jgi:hypothetical protein
VRFYAKFPWVQLFTGFIWLSLAYLNLHKPQGTSGVHAAYLAGAACWIFLSIWAVASYFLIYWDLDSDALLERRFWTFRRVQYAAITNVDPWGSQRASSGTIDIQFGKLGSALNPRTGVIASPLDRETFLNTLRKHAEQAEFSV